MDTLDWLTEITETGPLELRENTRFRPGPGQPAQIQIMGPHSLEVHEIRDLALRGVALYLRPDIRPPQVGARVELTAGSRRLVRCVSAGDGYLGQASRWLHFGLDGVPPIERLLVRGPDGSREEFAAPAGRGRYLAVRGKGRLELQGPLRPNGQPLPPLPALPPLPPLPAAEAVVLREPVAGGSECMESSIELSLSA